MQIFHEKSNRRSSFLLIIEYQYFYAAYRTEISTNWIIDGRGINPSKEGQDTLDKPHLSNDFLQQHGSYLPLPSLFQ